MGNWADDEMLALDFETTGVDRFNDVPVSFALVTLVRGERVSTRAGLINPGRAIPVEATGVHGITTEQASAKGMPLALALELVADAVVDASRRAVPLAGMQLDYDLTILDTQSRRLGRGGLSDRGWSGPVLDAVVLDRHHDKSREGSRTLGNLCAHYGVVIEHPHDAVADAVASAHVLVAMATRFIELARADPSDLHQAQVRWHREWAEGQDVRRLELGLTPMDHRDYVWPLAPVPPTVPFMRLTA